MLLGALAAVPAFLLDWYAVERNLARVKYLTKPLAMLALLAWFVVVNGSVPHTAPVRQMLLLFALGQVFSLAGDVFLLLPGRFFLWGLFAFLAAHLAYTASLGLWKAHFSGPLVGCLLAVAATSAGYFVMLNRSILRSGRTRKMSASVAVYITAISLMLLSAVSTFFQPGWLPQAAGILAAGAVLFFLSDGLLAYDKFVRPVSRGRLKVRILYHLGQLGLAAGITLQALAGG